MYGSIKTCWKTPWDHCGIGAEEAEDVLVDVPVVVPSLWQHLILGIAGRQLSIASEPLECGEVGASTDQAWENPNPPLPYSNRYPEMDSC